MPVFGEFSPNMLFTPYISYAERIISNIKIDFPNSVDHSQSYYILITNEIESI